MTRHLHGTYICLSRINDESRIWAHNISTSILHKESLGDNSFYLIIARKS
jgi:hypothetical protein